MRKVIITGATSMIGLSIINECISKGIKVLCIIRPGSEKRKLIPDSSLITVFECGLDELDKCHKRLVIQNYDIFFHLGWVGTDKDGRNDCRKQLSNVNYVLDAIQLAAKLGCYRFIGIGSQAEYGISNTLLTPDTPANPVTPYGAAKNAACNMSFMEAEKYDIECIWVRVLSVYGKNDKPETLISKLFESIQKKKTISLTSCEQKWDFLYADDAAKALLLVGEKGMNGKIYILGSGDSRQLKEYVESVLKVTGSDIEVYYGALSQSSLQPMFLEADIQELTADTGWKPEVPFEEGIMKIAEIMNIDILCSGGGVLCFTDCIFFVHVSFQENAA